MNWLRHTNLRGNRLVNVENMSEEDLKVIQKYYLGLSAMTKKDESLQKSHSIDEAKNMNQIKKDSEEDILDDLNEKSFT